MDWSKLPPAVLDQVAQYLLRSVDDMVCLGQVCRAWRAASRSEDQPANGAWQRVRFPYEDPMYSLLKRMDLPCDREMMHRQAGRFCRLVAAAPALGWVQCGKAMRPAARKALMNSKCKVRCYYWRCACNERCPPPFGHADKGIPI